MRHTDNDDPFADVSSIVEAHTNTNHPEVTITLSNTHQGTERLQGRVCESGVEIMMDGNRYAVLLIRLHRVIEASPSEVSDAVITSNHALVMTPDPEIMDAAEPRDGVFLTDVACQVPVGKLGSLENISIASKD